jgi:hypothetical protein
MQFIALKRRKIMQFQKGQSGNPAGRPRGSRNKASLRAQEMIEERAEEFVNKLLSLAIGGNIGALRLCLDRLVPARTNEPLLCEMPRVAKPADAVTAIGGLASAAIAGDVTADEAAKLANVVSLYVKALDAYEFEGRIAELERTEPKRLDARNNAPTGNFADPSHTSRNADGSEGVDFESAPAGPGDGDR